MKMKKILIVLTILFCCSTIASTNLDKEFTLTKAPQNKMLIGGEQQCFMDCDDEYDRCFSDVGHIPGGAFYCNYEHLMCIDECEFGRNF